MKAVNTTRRLRIAAVAMLIAAPALASCGVNFGAQTDQPYTPGVGVDDRSGTVDVLHALIVSGADGSGTVVAGLVNNDAERADALLEITGNPEQGTQVAIDGGPVAIPAAGAHQLADEGEAVASGEAIVPGRFVTLTFTFQEGADITLDVPVVSQSGDFADVPVPSAS